MLARLLQALAAYFQTDDDPTPGTPVVQDGAAPGTRDNERLFRILARTLVELAQAVRNVNQQVQANTTDIQAIKTKLGL